VNTEAEVMAILGKACWQFFHMEDGFFERIAATHFFLMRSAALGS
jgi:hypothetical protein